MPPRPPTPEPDATAEGGRALGSLLRPVALAVVLVGVLLFGVFSGRLPSTEGVRDFASGFGPLGPLVFVALSIGLSCLWVPGPILAGAAGLLFGTALGVPLAVASAALGAATQMLIVRHGSGRRALAAVSPRTRRVDLFLERRGLLAVVGIRLLPGIPFVATNYGAGLTRLSVGHMVLGTAIGSLPRSFAYVALGGSLDDLSSSTALLAFAVLVVFGGAGILWAAVSYRARHGAQAAGRADGAAPDRTLGGE